MRTWDLGFVLTALAAACGCSSGSAQPDATAKPVAPAKAKTDPTPNENARPPKPAGDDTAGGLADPGEKPLADLPSTPSGWRAVLSAEQFRVTRQKGTERPWSSPLADLHDDGVFRCVNCGQKLFSSQHKYESGTGWPSFFMPIRPEAVATEVDRSLFATRTEVHCSRCQAHLGHVFDDGPDPTGLRYCMNGVAMTFEPAAPSERDRPGSPAGKDPTPAAP